METAADLRTAVKELVEDNFAAKLSLSDVAVKIGHIINLAIRACLRGVQHTVRKNIVAEAVRDYCHVTMNEMTDEKTGNTYHKINITPRS